MDNICVAIRVRPINQREFNSTQQQQPWVFDTSHITQLSLTTGKPLGAYAFDYIYNSNSPTISLYDGVAKNIVRSAIDGVNGTIFAYGQTSSGKTFTMKGSAETPGIIPLAIRDVFSQIESCPSREFLLRVSYMEIYNEIIQDLLNPDAKNLKIHEDLEKGIYVGGIKEEFVVSPEQVLALMLSGEDRRHIGSTNMNDYSSRSHTIFRMVIESRERGTGGERKSIDGAVKVSMLNLVDLAGSERIAHTGAEGIRQKEGGHINKSLLALSTVIAKLSEGQKQHIPYRDSKLTRILQTALGGNARTAIICTVTPAAVHQEETLSTFKFATRAKNIKNKPVINEVMDEATMLRKYKDEIHTLKKQLAQREVVIEENSAKVNELESLRGQIDKLKGVIIHSSVPQQSETSRRPKRSSRRETWCPGEGMAPPLPLAGGLMGLNANSAVSAGGSASEEPSDTDIKADIDMELGLFNYKLQEFPFHSRKRLHTDSPGRSPGSPFGDQPKRAGAPLLAKIPAFQRAEMLLSVKKEVPIQDSQEVIELRKEVQRLKASEAELQATVDELQRTCDLANSAKLEQQQEIEKAREENDAIRHELEQMVALAKSSYAELEEAKALIDELESQDDSPDGWAEHKAELEKALVLAQKEVSTLRESLASSQQEVDALNETISESAVEADNWKTKFGDIQTEFDLAQANWSEREEELIALQAEAKAEQSSSSSEELTKMADELALLAKEKAELEAKCSSLVEDHAASKESWTSKYQDLVGEFERCNEENEADREKLSNEIFELEQSCDELRGLLQNKEEEIKALQENDVNRSVLPDSDSSELRAALEESNAERERLGVLLKEEEEKLSALQQQASEHETLLQSLNEEKEQLAGVLSERTTECERLTGVLAEKEAQMSEKEKEFERLSQVAGSTHVLQRERDQSMLVAVDLREQIKALQQRLETNEANIQAASKKAEEVLQAQLATAQQELTSLTERLLSVQQDAAAQIASHVSRCQNLEVELQKVTEKLEHQIASDESLGQRVKEAEREAQRHLDELRSLEGNASHATKRAQQLQTNADLSRQQCDSLSSKVAELTRENQKLEIRLSEADRLTRERVELMDSASRVKNDLAQTNAAYERQREELSKVQQLANRLQEALDEANHELSLHKNMLSATEEKANQAISEANRFRHEMDEREAASRRDQILHASQLEMKENEVQRVNEELARLQDETAEANVQASQLRKDLSMLTAAAKDYDRLSTELAQLKSRYATEVAQWKDESIKLKKELKASSSTNNSAEKERDTLGRELEKLKLKLETLDGKYKQTTQTNCSLEADKAAADRELKQIRKQNADLERNMEKLKTNDNKIKETAASLAQITKTHEALVKTHEALAKTSDKMRIDLDSKIAELAKETEAKVQLEMMITEIQAELQLRDTAIETLTREKTEELNKKKETEQVLLITVGKFDDSQRRLAEVEAQIETLTKETTDARQAKDQAEEEKEKLCGQLTEMHYAIEENRAEWSAKEFEYARDRDAAATELTAARESLQQLEAKCEELKASVEEKTTALEASTTEMDVLKEEVSKLQDELDKTRQDVLKTVCELNEAAEKDKENLGSANEKLGKATEELEQARQELCDTVEKLGRADAELNKVKEDAHGLLAKVEESALELNTTKEWAYGLQERIDELEKSYVQEKVVMVEHIQKQQRESDHVLQEANGRIERAQNEIRAWKEKAESLQMVEEENKMYQDRVGELQCIIDDMDVKMRSMEQTNGALAKKRAMSSEEECELDEVKREFAKFKEEAAEKEVSLSSMLDKMLDEAHAADAIKDSQFKYQKKIKELLQKLNKAEIESKRANEACTALSTELDSLRSEAEKRKIIDDGTLTKEELLSEVTRLEGVVAGLQVELETAKSQEAAKSIKAKAKMDFDSLYQDRRKAQQQKTPLGDCTNREF